MNFQRRATPARNADLGAFAREAALKAGTAAAIMAAERLESVSRFKRFRSARSSAALWYRSSESFSSDLLMTRSNSSGDSGFRRMGEMGALCKMESKTATEVVPVKG